MPSIRDEKTGTQEHLRDARYHYFALLADPDAQHLAPPVKKRIDELVQAEQATQERDMSRLEKQALCNRAEYLHDGLHRECELQVYAAVKKDRSAKGYRKVYPQGFSALIALSGSEQELEVTNMLKGLAEEQPAVAKTFAKDLAKLAKDATQAEAARNQAESEGEHAFASEVLARNEVFRQLRRNEGALLTLFPDDRARVRLYFRTQLRRRGKDEAETPETEGH